MHYLDLTPYEYGREAPRPNVLNVGWLSIEHPFQKGEVSVDFLRTLQRLVTSPVNLYRGSHLCEFCPPPPKELSAGGAVWVLKPPAGTTGNGEIRVPGLNGLVYVAPVLVAHYVEAHQYVPPAEFVDAVMALR
jgi:hypothetical protein